MALRCEGMEAKIREEGKHEQLVDILGLSNEELGLHWAK